MKKYNEPDFEVIHFDLVDKTNSDDEFFGGGGDDGGDVGWGEIDPDPASPIGDGYKVITW